MVNLVYTVNNYFRLKDQTLLNNNNKSPETGGVKGLGYKLCKLGDSSL